MDCACTSKCIRALLFLNLMMAVQMEGPENTDYYTAGVVEFRPTLIGTPTGILAEHLRAYLEILESKEAEDTDIIVFPEGTLNNALHLTFVPSENDRIAPCLTNQSQFYADFFVELSCAARRLKKYVVINLTEKEACRESPVDPRPCASNGLNVYNTNVVFDREGRVVSRYRKVHIYVENKNTTLQPEYAIFETDFGVRFGQFICFDILFYTPAQELVHRYGISDVIFTSMFYSELPFLTATQLQQGWAWGNNVNLLAAGASYPSSGVTGTGIYAGNQGALTTVMVKGKGERRLYKAQVPKFRKAKEFFYTDGASGSVNLFNKPSYDLSKSTELRDLSGIRLLKDPQIHNYNSILIDPMQTTPVHRELCFEDLCCTFDVTVGVPSSANLSSQYRYRIGVFDGRRTYEKEEWSDIKVCALYACASEDVDSCGEKMPTKEFHTPLVFQKISVRGKFPKSPKLLIMPTTIDYQLDPLPLKKTQWQKTEKGSHYDVSITLPEEHNNVMTFGIYAMYYEKSAGNSRYPKTLLGASIILCLILRTFY